MSTPGSLSAALAYLPCWWHEATDPAALDGLLVGWARACGWQAAGFVWPVDGFPVTAPTVRSGSLCASAPPAETADATRRIRSGEPTPLYPVVGSGGRVFAAVSLTGQPMGLLWAEKVAGQPWTPDEKAYLGLTARSLELSPAVALVTGLAVDPDRLYQRLGDAAVIAGRMAHDFDNILTGIIGFADLSVPLLPPGTQAAQFVGEIGKVGHRGIQFTQQLHQLSRSGQPRPGPGAVVLAVAKEETRLRPMMPPGLRFEKDLVQNLPAVALEAGALQSVLGHLIENAVEACPPGGLVRVTARVVEVSEVEARSYLGKVAAGSHVLVTVTDTGAGIKPEVRRRLFVEPFYTTKVRHRGLGLAVTYRTLCAHRGGVQLDSTAPPASGTQARVLIPVSAVRQPTASLAMTPPPASLVVHDLGASVTRTPPPHPAVRPDGRGAGGNTKATTAGG